MSTQLCILAHTHFCKGSACGRASYHLYFGFHVLLAIMKTVSAQVLIDSCQKAVGNGEGE